MDAQNQSSDIKRPLNVAAFMARAARRHVSYIGRRGDFITAPEISHVFGSLVGRWIASLSHHMALNQDWALVELGVGRGWLAYDIIAQLHRWRSHQSMSFHAVEHLDEFFKACEQKLARHAIDVTRHYHAASLPDDRPLVVIANEFFDALPIRQYVYEHDRWHERYVANGACYVQALSRHGEMRRSRVMDEALFRAGDVVEYSPAGMAWARALGRRIKRQGGALLVIDYGHENGVGDTCQALSHHESISAWHDDVVRGAADCSAHVNFSLLRRALTECECAVTPLVSQADFLRQLGIEAMVEQLRARHPHEERAWVGSYMRLCGRREMGSLFKVMASWDGHNEKILPAFGNCRE